MATPAKTRLLAGSLAVLAGVSMIAGVAVTTEEPRPGPSVDCSKAAEEMTQAATALWAALTPEQQGKAGFVEFRDHERQHWHFYPVPRKGIPLKDLTPAQSALAYGLVSTGLSRQGHLKALTIMSLGQVLRELDPKGHKPLRDSDQYYISIFGKLGPEATWGWRVEGFHLSLNFTIVGGRAIASAPSFFGSLPATIKEGPRKGLRTLSNEEDWARALVKSLDEEKRKVAILGPQTPVQANPNDVVGGLTTGNSCRLERRAPAGLSASRMTAPQAALLVKLVEEYAHRHRQELAEQDLEKVRNAGVDKIHFAWAGGLEPGEPHYYRIQGPTFLMEYDNTADGANHVHSVWRDYENDFGEDLLRRHYDHYPHK